MILCSVFLALWMLFWFMESLGPRPAAIGAWAVEHNVLVVGRGDEQSRRLCRWRGGLAICTDALYLPVVTR